MTVSEHDARRAADLLEELRDRASVWGSDTFGRPDPLADNPEWLRVPANKRVVALARHHVLTDYNRQRTRTKAEAEAAAARMGVKLRSFYAILKHWRENGRSPLKLVSYASGDGGGRRSRLAEPVAVRLRELVQSAIAEAPDAAVRDLVTAVKQAWGKEAGLPTDVTVRAFIDRALGERNDPAPVTVTDPFDRAQQLDEPVTRFGQALVIDHTAPASILVDEDELLAPTITLAIDLHTGTPLGGSVYDNYPNGDGVIEAVEDAMRRLRGIAGGPEFAPPTIMFATTFDLEWRGLGDELGRMGHPTVEHTSATLANGDPIRRAFGSKLGDVALQSTKAVRRRSADVEDDTKAALTLDEARTVVLDAVAKAFGARVPEDAAEQMAQPSTPEPGGRSNVLMRRLGTASNFEMRRSRWPATSDRMVPALPRDARVLPGLGAMSYGFGSSRGTRSPRLFERQLERLARDVAGDSFVSVTIGRPDGSHDSWDVAVEVDDDAERPLVWVELARLATEFYDLEGTLVQVTVLTSPDA
ncbi:hypothetical protein U1737_16920 [Sphingomonas sp. LB3N6]|uniref:hypothetical protein n=1 Tax=Sphingomonas fucosidasi TaxID=3096164 RepID=UPI002FC90092